jgi:hypothetical protein
MQAVVNGSRLKYRLDAKISFEVDPSRRSTVKARR